MSKREGSGIWGKEEKRGVIQLKTYIERKTEAISHVRHTSCLDRRRENKEGNHDMHEKNPHLMKNDSEHDPRRERITGSCYSAFERKKERITLSFVVGRKDKKFCGSFFDIILIWTSSDIERREERMRHHEKSSDLSPSDVLSLLLSLLSSCPFSWRTVLMKGKETTQKSVVIGVELVPSGG